MLANEIIRNDILNHNLLEMKGENEIDSRFGKININYDKKILIEKGLLGISDKLYFCITQLPVKKFPQFKLLQSLEEFSLSLILMPISLQNEIIAAQDLLDTIQDLSISPENCDIFLVVNVYRDLSNVRLSVNARAPIFVDKTTSKGEQMVLRNNKYMVRHMISGELSKPAH